MASVCDLLSVHGWVVSVWDSKSLVADRIWDLAEFSLIRGLFLLFLIASYTADFCRVLASFCKAKLRFCNDFKFFLVSDTLSLKGNNKPGTAKVLGANLIRTCFFKWEIFNFEKLIVNNLSDYVFSAEVRPILVLLFFAVRNFHCVWFQFLRVMIVLKTIIYVLVIFLLL